MRTAVRRVVARRAAGRLVTSPRVESLETRVFMHAGHAHASLAPTAKVDPHQAVQDVALAQATIKSTVDSLKRHRQLKWRSD